MNGTGSRAHEGLDPANTCMHDWKSSVATGFWVCPERRKQENYVATPNKTSWRGFASTEEIAQFLSRSVSTVRSSGLAAKQPS